MTKIARTHVLPNVDIRMTAILEGVITSRVRLLGPLGGKTKRGKPPRPVDRRASRPAVASNKVAALHGNATTKFHACMWPHELDELNDACLMTQMSRSQFLRQAAKHYIGKVRAAGACWRDDIPPNAQHTLGVGLIVTKSNVSMTERQLVEIDEFCQQMQMSRSKFLRRATVHFYSKLFDGNWRAEAAKRRGGAR